VSHRCPFVVACSLAVVVALATSGVAGSESKGQRRARRAATELVASYLPTGDKPGLCDRAFLNQWLAGRTVFESSCATNDGSFQLLVFTSATRSFDAEAALRAVQHQTTYFCNGGGAVYITGVKGKFIEAHAGKGPSGIAVAQASQTLAQRAEAGVLGANVGVLC
jgi:hypothetical protein